MGELRAVDPRARFVQAEPLLAIHHDPQGGDPTSVAQGHHEAQFQAFDMISGRIWPQLGGEPAFLDIVGVNYYWNNQWIHGGPAIDMDHPAYRPLADLLFEVAARYDRPLMIAETGTEGARRASWFAYIRDQVDGARRRGVRIEGSAFTPSPTITGGTTTGFARTACWARIPRAAREASNGRWPVKSCCGTMAWDDGAGTRRLGGPFRTGSPRGWRPWQPGRTGEAFSRSERSVARSGFTPLRRPRTGSPSTP
ncbi:hypothetical protein ACFSYD_21000 [Paracoccus aerius]